MVLGCVGKSIPLFWRGSCCSWEWSSVEGGWPWEADSVGLYDVSYECSHGNTSVLDFSLTKESDGCFVGFSPDGGGCELKWIVVLLSFYGRVLYIVILFMVFLQVISTGNNSWDMKPIHSEINQNTNRK